jgi:hypothetical protein
MTSCLCFYCILNNIMHAFCTYYIFWWFYDVEIVESVKCGRILLYIVHKKGKGIKRLPDMPTCNRAKKKLSNTIKYY